MKLSDYVMDFLVRHEIKEIFTVSGGGIMHLLDSLGRNPELRYYCNYHEQACAVSAEGYARVTNGVGACLVTVGPGGVNALSGILGAWTDSLPVLVIAGQVRRELIADYTKVRQVGPQEGNVVGMAKAVTKYAVTVLDPTMIRYELEKAYHKATSGRPGPVLIEIPLDVQGSEVEESKLVAYDEQPSNGSRDNPELLKLVREVVESLRSARRPLLLCGNGIHLARAEELLVRLLDKTGLPLVLPDAAKDLVAEDHPSNMGIFGAAGQRRANFAVQNSDCLVALGAGLCVKKTGFNLKGFAPNAKKVIVDIDEGQLFHQVIKADLPVLADIRSFLEVLLKELEGKRLNLSSKWLDACARWKARYPLIVEEFYQDREHVNSYVFMDILSDLLSNSDVVVGGNGLDTVSYIQAFKVKPGQRTMTSINWGAMGWDLPLSVGACLGSGKRRTICVTGDGSIQFNVQELLTIRRYSLPIKIFVFNNHGYGSIRGTQQNFFNGRLVGADFDSGVSNPDFKHLAAAYGLAYTYLRNNEVLRQELPRVLALDGPVLCEVNISREQGISPKVSAFRREDGTLESRPLEDMAPFLPREEVWENMHLFDNDTLSAI
jgi:acetolactate synthase I/II/III large subunit